MNSKSLQYNHIADSMLEKLAKVQIFITGVIRKLPDYLTRSKVEQAQASYKMQRKHETQAGLHQDIVGMLPIEEKLRLGMYHFIQ